MDENLVWVIYLLDVYLDYRQKVDDDVQPLEDADPCQPAHVEPSCVIISRLEIIPTQQQTRKYDIGIKAEHEYNFEYFEPLVVRVNHKVSQSLFAPRIACVLHLERDFCFLRLVRVAVLVFLFVVIAMAATFHLIMLLVLVRGNLITDLIIMILLGYVLNI